MTTIHHEESRQEYLPDPDNPHRQILKHTRVPSGVDRLKYKGKSYERDEEGNFDVPPDVAAHWLRFPGWKRDKNPLPPEAPEPKGTRRAAKASAGAV